MVGLNTFSADLGQGYLRDIFVRFDLEHTVLEIHIEWRRTGYPH